MQSAAWALFIFTWTFQELTAIPLSGELIFSAIFQTPVCKLPLTLVWDNEEWVSYWRFRMENSENEALWNEKSCLYSQFKCPVRRWDVLGWSWKKCLKIEIYSSAVCTQRCFFGCHRRLAWDLYLSSWQTWQCSFATWLPERPLSKCHCNQIVTSRRQVTLLLTTRKNIHTVTREKSLDLAYIFRERDLQLHKGGSCPHCCGTRLPFSSYFIQENNTDFLFFLGP